MQDSGTSVHLALLFGYPVHSSQSYTQSTFCQDLHPLTTIRLKDADRQSHHIGDALHNNNMQQTQVVVYSGACCSRMCLS